MERIKDIVVDFYQHYKYYHFFAICFGLGWGTALYSPFRPIAAPAAFGTVFALFFEFLGQLSSIQAHSKTCKGPPYDRQDVYVGFIFAFVVATLNLKSYNGCPLSCGCGLIVFAICGATRKNISLGKTYKS